MNDQKKGSAATDRQPSRMHSQHNTTKRNVTHMRLTKEPVVVCLHHDHWIEVYGNVDARIINLPTIATTSVHTPNPDFERLAEDFVWNALPPKHRKVFFPGLIAAADKFERVCPSELHRRSMMTELIKSIKVAEVAK